MNHQIIIPKRIQFHNHRTHYEWTKEQEQFVRNYLLKHGFQKKCVYLGEGRSYIGINGKLYSIFWFVKQYGYFCTVAKQSRETETPDGWKHMKHGKQHQHPNKPNNYAILSRKEDVPFYQMPMPTGRIFYMDPINSNPIARKPLSDEDMKLAQLTKQLRERTGRGLMVCRRALVESNLDIDEAYKLLMSSEQFSWKRQHTYISYKQEK